MSDTLTKPDVDSEISFEMLIDTVAPYEDNNDPEHRSHVVNAAMNGHIQRGVYMTAREIVETARVLKMEVVALCGFKWIPKGDPEKHDVCDACMKLAGELMRGAGE